MSFVVRTASLADAERVALVADRARCSAYGMPVLDTFAMPEVAAGTIEIWEKIIRDPQEQVRVACLRGEIVGACRFKRSSGTKPRDFISGVISEVCIDPNSHRRGYGRVLMQDAMSRLRGMGLHFVHLAVLEANHRSHAFVRSLGFRAHGSQPADLHGLTVQFILYSRQL